MALSFATVPSLSISWPRLSNVHTETRLLVTLCHADCTFHNPTKKGGVAAGGAAKGVPVDPGVAGLLPVRPDTLGSAPKGDPMLYDWLIFVLEKKDEAAAKTESIADGSLKVSFKMIGAYFVNQLCRRS